VAVSYRAIPKFSLGQNNQPAAIVGQIGRFELIAIEKLRVDTRYQRELVEVGKFRVREIALGFDWRRFTPIVCAAIAGGLYAVIDGQHRAAAVLSRGGIERLPAWIIDADTVEQAKAFIAIN